MTITAFDISNYKSILNSGVQTMAAGFNILVGKNNAGKTATLEALSLTLSSQPHRSLKTLPLAGQAPSPRSVVKLTFTITQENLRSLLPELDTPFQVTFRDDVTFDEAARLFADAISAPEVVVTCEYSNGAFTSIQLARYGEIGQNNRWFNGAPEMHDDRIVLTGVGGINSGGAPQVMVGYRLAEALKRRLYVFRAERLNITSAAVGDNPVLASNAANLPQVLNRMQNRNPVRYREYNRLVTRIFPDILQVTAPYVGDRVELQLWAEDPETEREDLAIPLSESGTGTGQVLAILYVVMNAPYPQTILIDEPQSFLHPGAIRKLFEILREYPQHQYIITTHAPTALSVLDASRLLVLSKSGLETVFTPSSMSEAQDLRFVLAEVGVRLADVFGADNVLWVEGKTEEECFPLILRQVLKRPQLGTVILGILQIGDLEGKHKERVLEIYTRLVSGRGVLPPALGFVFDREGRSERDRQDLVRQSKGQISFLARRMYENYLLSPDAIVAVANAIEGFRDTPLTVEEVTDWLAKKGHRKPFFDSAAHAKDAWEVEVAGGQLLAALFDALSENRVSYDKVRHGRALTVWLLERSPEALREIAEVIDRNLGQAER